MLTDELIGLIGRLEDELLFVDAEAIWQASRKAEPRPGSRRQLRSTLEAGVAEGLLFTDARLHVDREAERLEPVQLFRVNRHHPRVARALRGR